MYEMEKNLIYILNEDHLMRNTIGLILTEGGNIFLFIVSPKRTNVTIET